MERLLACSGSSAVFLASPRRNLFCSKPVRCGSTRRAWIRMCLGSSSASSSSSSDNCFGGDGFGREMRVLSDRIDQLKQQEELDRKAAADEFHSTNFATEMLLLQERIRQIQNSGDETSDPEWMLWEKNCNSAIQLEISLLLDVLQERLRKMRPSTVLIILSLVSTFTAASSVILIASIAAMLKSS